MIEVVIHSSTGGDLSIARFDVMTAHQSIVPTKRELGKRKNGSNN